ncbi:hypothetical protein X975_00703, partial [Stegodyphus mimosarum]
MLLSSSRFWFKYFAIFSKNFFFFLTSQQSISFHFRKFFTCNISPFMSLFYTYNKYFNISLLCTVVIF